MEKRTEIKLLQLKQLVCLSVLFSLTGCIKYHKAIKSEFPQGEQKESGATLARTYRKSLSIYDQFATLARFEFLLYDEVMRRSYVDLYCRKRGLDEQFRTGMLRRELDENRQEILFYVLADIRGKAHTALGDLDAIWTLSLQEEEGANYSPSSIEQVELSPEMITLFGCQNEAYKTAYIVKFRRPQTLSAPLKDAPLKLVIHSPDRAAEVFWGEQSAKPINAHARIIKQPSPKKKKINEDCYWL